MDKRSFDSPDESLQPADKITADVIEIGGQKLYRTIAQTGWKWSVDLKPVQQTASCQMDHLLYMISGGMTVRMDDGQELQFGPGDLAHIPPGHDGWDSAGQPTVWIELPH
jgi:mannose-6-phosphate isomerase-like protein (cupin superfamily)